MAAKSGFLQTRDGHNSSSRLLGFGVTIWALVLATVMLGYGLFTPPVNLMILATSTGTLFTTIAGPAMIYLFSSKKAEQPVQQPDNSTETPAE